MSGTRPNTRAKVASTGNNGDMVQVTDEPQPPLKRKHANKKQTAAAKLKVQKAAADVEQQCAVNIWLANLEAECSVDTDLLTPRPVDQSTSAAGLRRSNS